MKQLQLTKKEGLPDNVICVSGQAEEVLNHILEGYIVPQENVFGVELAGGESLFVGGFRSFFAEMDFVSNLKSVIASGFDGILDGTVDAGNWLASYITYVGAIVARNNSLELQVSRRRKCKIENRSAKDIDVIVANLMFICGRLGYSHSQQRKIKTAIRELI